VRSLAPRALALLVAASGRSSWPPARRRVPPA